MLPSKLNLIGRTDEDILREFQVLLMKTKTEKVTQEQKENWNGDINGWVNWLETLREK